MKLILGLSVVLCILLSQGEAATCKQLNILRICYESSNITQIQRVPAARDIATWPDEERLILTPDGQFVEILKPGNPRDLRDLIDLSFFNLQFSNEARLPVLKLGGLLFDNNGLTEVPTDLFSNVDPYVLRIVNNPIRVIHANAFSPLKNLSALILNNNSITTLEPGCFNGLEKLEHLELKFNHLILTPGVFSSLESLNYLKIVHSVAEGGFHAQAFRGLPNLSHLEILIDHEITLEPGMFDDNPGLRSMSLRNNKFRHIPKNVFNNLRWLENLNLNNNIIESIEAGALTGTIRELRMYNAYKGGIINTGTFSAADPNVRASQADLSGNEITEIEPRAFEGFRVELLDISENNITEIGAETFAGINAWKIDLRDNPIVHVDLDAFKNATVLSLIVNPDSISVQDRYNWKTSYGTVHIEWDDVD